MKAMNEMDMKYGFLFDLDGVLIDSEKEYTKIWSTVNAEYPTGVPSFESRIKGCTLDKILDDYFPDREIREKVVKRLYELEGKMHYEYLPGAVELLKELRKRNFPAALVTSSNDDKMRHLDEELPEIRSYFTTIITADLISKSKPDPEGYLLAAKKIDCDIKNSIVFEDSYQGVKAGRRSGAYVVGVKGTVADNLLEEYSDKLVGSLAEIKLDDLLNELKQRNLKIKNE